MQHGYGNSTIPPTRFSHAVRCFLRFLSWIRAVRVFVWCFLCSIVLSCSTLWTSLSLGSDYEPFIPIRLSFPTIERVDPEWEVFVPGIELSSGSIRHPHLQFWAARIFLENPHIQIQVGPEGKNGKGESIKPSTFALRYGCQITVNANPFDPSSETEGEPRRIVGIGIREGRIFSPPNPKYACLLFLQDERAIVTEQVFVHIRDNQAMLDSVPIQHGVGGFFIVLKNNCPLAGGPLYRERYPRTAAGVNREGSILFLLVIDGYRRSSMGATEEETGAILRKLGASDGLLLDGGGSSAFVIRQPNGGVKVLNVPMHNRIPRQERAVALCLGIRSLSER